MLCTESQAQSETIRAALENLQAAIRDYMNLMNDSTASHINTVVKIGAALAEVFILFSFPLDVLRSQMNSFAKVAFGLANGTFDVGLSSWGLFARAYIPPVTQLLKEQRNYDENVSDLADGIDAILPFAERALEGLLYEEELLDRVIRRLYDLIGDTAVFVIDYAKRGPPST
jgi:hypothetical protein